MLPLAHALEGRQDLPIPEWLFAWGASLVLIVSFFALSAAWREPRFEDERRRPLSAAASRVLLGLPMQALCGAIGVFLLGVAEISVEAGDDVRFQVTSPVADEVHIHGYDVLKEVPAGGTATFNFPADIEGVFEVELHHGEEQIAELRVNP